MNARHLTRFAAIGILIISCSDEITGPGAPVYEDPCGSGPTSTGYERHPDSLRLPLGAADYVVAFMYVSGPCLYEQRPPEGMVLTVRDSSIASAEFELELFTVVSLKPGRTYVVFKSPDLIDSISVSVPDTFAMAGVTALAAGGSTSCAVSESDRLMCWGWGGDGLLGDPTVEPAIGTCYGSPCSPMPMPLNVDARSVYMGQSSACSLDAFGSASCWGYQSDALFAAGTTTFASLTLGSSHGCGLTPDGIAMCWGSNLTGQLGTGAGKEPSSSPELVHGDLRWTSLAASDATTCGVTDGGELYCWGVLSIDAGIVAGATTCELPAFKGASAFVPCSPEPLKMPPVPGAGTDTLLVQVSGSCALSSSGSVYCAEFGTVQYSLLAGSTRFTSISGGQAHSCGLTADGSALCWGSNYSGQLGDGSTLARAVPVAVGGLHSFTDLAVGSDHSCGLSIDGEVWCWGGNGVGQSGTSILDHPTLPVRVRGQGG